MEGLKIELAQEADIPAMLELWRNTPGLGAGDDATSLAAFIERNPGTCLLIRSGTAVISTVLGGFDGRRGYVYHLAVHPDFQRRGWGKKILQEVVDRFGALKAEKIHLFVFKDNQGAQAFYNRQAWIKRQDIEVFTVNPQK
ncbi:MAG: GNAT family N-acetyltransferase [Syntrophomonadaceae bacterium]